MNHYLKRICSFVIATVLALSSIFAGLPASTVFAAEDTYTAARLSTDAERVDEAAVKAALDSIERARNTGSREDYIKARNRIALLRPIDRLRLYANLIRDYYLKNFRNTGFRYFNAEKYLAEYEDVRLDALRYSPDDIYLYALYHYLEHGITEGRSSGTSFDPMVAILVKPEVLFDVIFASDDTVSDILYESYVQKTGYTSTDMYSVLIGSLIVIGNTDIGGVAPAPSDSQDSSASSDDTSDSNDESSDSHTPDDEPAQQEDQRERKFINNLARDITPYTLYRDTFHNESFSYISYNPFDDVNNNKKVEVRFWGDNYRIAKELSANKKYTMMLYLCGTNLENNKDYRRVSGEIVSMLQADMSNVNVILCVGGTETYGNNYLNDPEYGASGLRAGIYYLNPGGLSEEVRSRLANINVGNGDTICQLSDNPDDSDRTDLSYGLRFSDIINSDSLIRLVSTSAVDMADPSFLAGFINLSTNLFPADDYGLTLSDHGGGLEGGVIFTDSNDELQSNGIAVYKLESALAATDLYKNKSVSPDGKLGVIFYSACTMGSTELAYSTKDYYRYMIASEEITSGHDSYRDIISGLNYDVGMGASDLSIAKGLAYTFEISTPSHHGFNDYIVGSIATYSSEAMDNMYDRINELAAEFSEILGTDKYSDDMKNDVFIAFRKAALTCYPTCNADVSHTYYQHMVSTSYVDIGELLTHVRNNLDTVLQNRYNSYSSSDRDEFEKLMEKLDNTLNTGFLVYLSVYNKEMGGLSAIGMNDAVIPLNYTMNTRGNIWTDIRLGDGPRDYLYGSSIYLPLLKGNEFFNEEYSEYYKYFKDSDLDDYVNFITDYLKYLNDESETGYKKNMDDLRSEMADIRLYDLVSQVKDSTGNVLRTLSDDNGHSRDYISFKIPGSYEEAGIETPLHSLGSPMLDIIETQPLITVAALHKQRFAAQRNGQEGFVEVSMICAEEPVPVYSFALDSNTISFNVTDTTSSIIAGMTMEGKRYGETGNDTDWQFVLRSDIDRYDTDKLALIKTIFPEVQELTDVNTITVSGKYKPDQGVDANCYHVFKVRDDNKNEYSYEGSVETVLDAEGNPAFSKAEDVIAVSACHYVLKKETDESGNVKYTRVSLEEIDGVDDGFFDIQDLVLKTGIEVTQAILVDGNWEYNGVATAYCIDPSGRGEYSDIGYISERDYNTGSITVGNGPLGTVEYDDAQMAGIGTFGTEGPDDDTEVPDESGSIELPIHIVGANVSEPAGDDPAPAEDDITAPEVAHSVAEGPVVVEAPIENDTQQDTVEPALVEPSREETESDVPSPDSNNENCDVEVVGNENCDVEVVGNENCDSEDVGNENDDSEEDDNNNSDSDSDETDSGSSDQED